MPRAAVGIAAALALLTSGCTVSETASPTSPRDAPGATADSSPGVRALPTRAVTEALWGAWTVVGARDASGRALYVPAQQDKAARDDDGSPPMRVLFGNGEVSVMSQCVTMGPFGYRQTATGTEPAPPPERPPSYVGEPIPMCARGLSDTERLVPSLLQSAMVLRAATGGVEVSSDKGALVLRRQGVVANPGGWAPPPRVPPPWGAWRIMRIDGRVVPADRPIHLAIGGIGIHYTSGCVAGAAWLKRDQPLDAIVPDGVKSIAVCDRGRYAEEERMDRLLTQRSRARMDARGAITLELARGGRIEGEPLD